MGILISQLSVDAAEPRRLAAWWADVLGWRLGPEADDDEAWIGPPSGASGDAGTDDLHGILFVAVPETKTIKNRLHLDVRPTDGSSQATELARLLGLGATPVDIGQGDVPWHVLADPEGNEFCLLRSTPSELTAKS